MRRTLPLILILVITLTACQKGPTQVVQSIGQQAVHPCPLLLHPGPPIWSMDSSKIAYASLPQNGAITHFAIDLASRHVTQLTHDGDATVHGVKGWTRDGSALIVVTADGTMLLNTDGTGVMN